MTIDCRIPTEEEDDTYDQDKIPVGCEVIPNCEKCLANID
jgi:hypothetical protein